jgi:uncharacterized membrane protein YdjX (TVP38/TMEM64 family)
MGRAPAGPSLVIGFLAGLVIVALVARRALGLDWTAESVRALVSGFGLWGPPLFVGLVAFRPVLLIPSQILLVAGGVCFGAFAGTAYGALGMLICGSLVFQLARRMGREAFQARFPVQLEPVLDAAGRRWGAAFIAVGTAYPLGPVTAYHAGAGLTRMTAPRFLLALAPGAIARAALFTLFGAMLAEGNVRTILLATAALFLVVLLPLAHTGLRQRLWRLLGYGDH